MRIDSPLFAINALQRTAQALNRSLQRLASGSRINSASDDPAGLSMATGLESQLRGSSQAILNINQASSELQVADGALQTQTSIVQRMKEITLEAATGTLSANDRALLNTELQQLFAEYDRIAGQTTFNGANLLDGSFGTQNIQVGAQSNANLGVGLNSSRSVSTFTKANPYFTRSTINNSADGDLVLVDMNGDGIPDLVSTQFTHLAISIGNGDGTFKAANLYGAATGGVGTGMLYVGDLNHDGKKDVVIADTADNWLDIFLGNGDGTMQALVTMAAGNSPYSPVIADFNGDGNPDIALTDTNDNDISLYLGNGNGTFQARQTISVVSRASQMSVGDINGDGKPDLAIGGWGTNQITVLLGNGNGTFASGTTLAGPIATISAQLADVNNDGNLDIVSTGNGDSNTYIYLGNGNGTFQAVKTVAMAASYQAQVGDLNGDGLPDLVTIDSGANMVSYAFGNGDGTFQAAVTLAAASNPFTNGIAIGDLNADGRPDIVSADIFSGDISIFMQGRQTVSAVSDVQVLNAVQARRLLPVLDIALQNLMLQRSNLGASQSRLSSAVDLNQSLVMNLTAAKSNISDVDYAAETAELMKQQILEQAGVSVLSQANLQNQLVLKLFNF